MYINLTEFTSITLRIMIIVIGVVVQSQNRYELFLLITEIRKECEDHLNVNIGHYSVKKAHTYGGLVTG